MIQAKGTGLSHGLKSSFSTYHSLRGVERLVLSLSIIFGVLLVVNSLAIIFLS